MNSRFGPRLTETGNPRARHNGLIIYLANSITSDQFKKLKQMSRVNYFQPKELEDCDVHDFLNALEDKGHIGVGRYEVLKDLLKECGIARLVQDVEEAEADIKEMERTANSRQFFYTLLWIKLESMLVFEYANKQRRNSRIVPFSEFLPMPATATRMSAERLTKDRVVSWKVTESGHGEFLKTLICGLWANSSNQPGQREWGGHKAVIDLEALDEVLGNLAARVGRTVLEILASMPDVPKETLFILNVTQRPDLKTKWKRLLDGNLFPDAKVLLFEGGDDQGIARGGKKRKLNGCSCELNGEVTGAQWFHPNSCTIS